MNIISYKYSGSSENDISFPKIYFRKINLIVGDSATGKTRLLNTIANLGKFITEKRNYLGNWEILFSHKDQTYIWSLISSRDENNQTVITLENLIRDPNGENEIIIERNENELIFNGDSLPKLSRQESAISLLQLEEDISPVYEGIESIFRRNFSGSELEKVSFIQQYNENLFSEVKDDNSLCKLNSIEISLSNKLYFLSEKFPQIYRNIHENFLIAFPFIEEAKVAPADEVLQGSPFQGYLFPVFAIREKDIDKWIPITEFSSGMKKTLLLFSDINCLPNFGTIYLIDEYENSLGINAIDLFPTILLDDDTSSQFILTSHHPYIIGNIPVKNWIVLHRKGSNILVKQGDELEEKYGRSKQQTFIQLINDPFYTNGVE